MIDDRGSDADKKKLARLELPSGALSVLGGPTRIHMRDRASRPAHDHALLDREPPARS